MNEQDALPKPKQALAAYLKLTCPRTKNVEAEAEKMIDAFGGLRKLLAADPDDVVERASVSRFVALAVKAASAMVSTARSEEWRRGKTLGCPSEVASYLRETIGEYAVECFYVLYVDQRNQLLGTVKAQQGTVDQTVVYPREILKKALSLNACGLVLCHNHPGGSLTPSDSDRQLTHQIMTASKAMGITVHDHLIVTAEGSFSFRQAGMLG
jgi:DNA repair protein RadC